MGGFLTGIFATKEGCAAFAISNAGGAIAGNGRQVWVQIVGALFVIGWDTVWTTLVLLFIKHVLRVKLRFSDDVLVLGDDAVHGEAAYCFYDSVDGGTPLGVLEGRAIHDTESGSPSGSGHAEHLGMTKATGDTKVE